jgi:hypothetical protein
MGTCSRYHLHGNQCQNLTDQADGWCGQDDCPGFLRESPRDAPGLKGRKFYGPPEEVLAKCSNAANLKADPRTIAVSANALEMFVFHHGGTADIATLQIREMLVDFVESAGKIATSANFLSLAMEGYRLFVNPQRNRVTGYSTTHRERTWQQIKADIPSRIGQLEALPVLTPDGPKDPKPEPVPGAGDSHNPPVTPKPMVPKTSDGAKLQTDSGGPNDSGPSPQPQPQPQPKPQPYCAAADPESKPSEETTAPKASPTDPLLLKIGFAVIAGFAAGWLSRSGRRR